MRALERLRFATRARVTLTANFIVTLCWSTTAPGLEDVADPQWDSFADGAGGDDEESSDTVTALWGYEVRRWWLPSVERRGARLTFSTDTPHPSFGDGRHDTWASCRCEKGTKSWYWRNRSRAGGSAASAGWRATFRRPTPPAPAPLSTLILGASQEGGCANPCACVRACVREAVCISTKVVKPDPILFASTNL